MNVAKPVIEALHEYRCSDVIAHVQRVEPVFDRIFHGHCFHPPFDLLTLNFRDVPLRVERDDDAIELVFLDRQRRFTLAGA